jgi:hypothetical protein
MSESPEKPKPNKAEGDSSANDWLSRLATSNPTLLVASLLFLYLTGRLQSPDEKKQLFQPIEFRISAIERDIVDIKSAAQTHHEKGGHLKMEFRMDRVEEFIEKFEERTHADIATPTSDNRVSTVAPH